MTSQCGMDRIDFLDLDGCSPEDVQRLETLLHGASEPAKRHPPPLPTIPHPLAVVSSSSSLVLNGHGGFAYTSQPHQLPLHAYPNVYINNVTANVNVHSSAPPPQVPPQVQTTSQQQQQHHHHHRHMQPPPPLPHEVPHHLLHHPQTMVSTGPPGPAGFINPFPTGGAYHLGGPMPMYPFMSFHPQQHPMTMQPFPQNVSFNPATAFQSLTVPHMALPPQQGQGLTPQQGVSPHQSQSPMQALPQSIPMPVVTEMYPNEPSHEVFPLTGDSNKHIEDVQEKELEEAQQKFCSEKEEAYDDVEYEEPTTAMDVASIEKEAEDKEDTLELDKPEIKEPKSWASLFHKNDHSTGSQDNPSGAKPMAKISPYVNGTDVPNSHASGDENILDLSHQDSDLAKYLKEYTLNHKSASLKPRGLSNRSNWCFVNAVLQALVACPPFYNFIKSMPIHDDLPSMGISRAVWEFVQDIEVMTTFPKLNRRDKGKKAEDLPLGKTVEATSIYNMLLSLNSDTFKVVEGRQEDGEEFLTFLLNGINDEIQAALKYSSAPPEAGVAELSAEPPEESEDWKEVGPRNKSCTTRRQVSAQTPLADMFQGQIRSCVQHSSSEPTATLQPFFTLQLDIQSESVRTVGDALLSNFATESLDGYVCTTTKQEVEASRSLSLEDLPPILVLHMKRFIYDETSSGCQKLLKNIDFPVDLEVAKEILSPNSRNKFHAKQRQYKLFAVVYHNGTEATKGHYVTDVYHTGLATWLRCDDSLVKAVSESSVLMHYASSVPYILFYRRGDTMVGLDKNK